MRIESKNLKQVLVVAGLAAIAACGTPTSPDQSSVPYSQTDLTVGTGTTATAGKSVTVNYTGWLYDSTKAESKGTQFDTRNGFPFTLGVGQVIAGWDQGVAGMKVGGTRRLVIPPSLAYGSAGAGTAIPPNAALVFDVTLTAVS